MSLTEHSWHWQARAVTVDRESPAGPGHSAGVAAGQYTTSAASAARPRPPRKPGRRRLLARRRALMPRWSTLRDSESEGSHCRGAAESAAATERRRAGGAPSQAGSESGGVLVVAGSVPPRFPSRRIIVTDRHDASVGTSSWHKDISLEKVPLHLAGPGGRLSIGMPVTVVLSCQCSASESVRVPGPVPEPSQPTPRLGRRTTQHGHGHRDCRHHHRFFWNVLLI